MAALKRSKKTGALRKNQQGRLVTKRGKLPLKPKRNVCIIRFPRSGYLTSCPLVSWYFNRRMQNDVLSLQKTKHNLSPCMVDAHHHHKMSLRLLGRQPHPSHTCSVFLRAALKEVASKKRAKWVAASSSSKKRRRYADNEIFYRLAKPSGMEDTEDGSSGMAAGASEMTPTSLGITQPTAGELQEALS